MAKAICDRVKMEATFGAAKKSWDDMSDWRHDANNWRIVLGYKGRQYSLDFWTGTMAGEPTVKDVLHCLVMDDPSDSTFEEWARDLGYDTDSRRAEKIYNECVSQTKGAKKLLGEDFEKVREELQDY